MIETNEAVLEGRQAVLEDLLLWEGRLNRARLMELFGIGPNSASVAIRKFREQHPDYLSWDTKTRSFHATAEVYRARYTKDTRRLADALSLSRYLNLAGLPYATTDGSPVRGMLAAFPELSTPSPQHFAFLLQAIQAAQAVEITYRSMREPKPHRRMISPHNLIRAGRRWHVRAYCSTNESFRDYALGRIVDVKPLKIEAVKTEQDDIAWMTRVAVRLIAHPNLTTAQEDVIRFEYFGNTSARIETCRGALVSYFVQDSRAAIDVKTQRPPDYQLAVANMNEVRPWLFPS